MKNQSLLLLLFLFVVNQSISAQKAKDQIILDCLHLKSSNKRDSLGVFYQQYFSIIKSINDSSEKKYWQTKIDSLDIITEGVNEEDILIDLEFARTHPSSSVALNALLFRLNRKGGINYLDEIQKLFYSFTPSLQKAKKGVEFKETLLNIKRSAVGSYAPDFHVRDNNNKSLVLGSFRGQKYVLLDFWASWCGPCREDFSFLKDLYNKYEPKGLEIIAVSRDDKSDLWKKAIIDDELDMWKHFSIKENKSMVEKLFFVTAIPVKILINKEGKIIGRWRGSSEENNLAILECLRKEFIE